MQLHEHRRADDLLARLPLPLAQLYRRASNAKSPQDRHHNAYYLTEAALKLSACLRIGAALRAGLEPRSPLARLLEQVSLPSVGHWVSFLREATLHLRARPDAALLPLADLHERLLEARSFPAVRAFAERAARGEEGESPAIAADVARDGARQGTLGFFNVVAAYRNQVFGHGAQRLAAFYEELGPLLLEAAAQVLADGCLFGGMTLAVAHPVPDGAGRVAGVEWQGLEGLGGLALHPSRVGPEPGGGEETVPGHIHFVAPGVRIPLHPLVIYQEDRSERERVGFLNRTVTRRRGDGGAEVEEVRRVEYLDYATGDVLPEADARAALAALLARLRGEPATASDVDRVIDASQADLQEEEMAPEPGAGEAIGDFDLEGELGRGGMGVVYRARQRSLNRRVALKVLPPALSADPVALARFRREIAALARADHPNMVKIITSGSDGDRHYYAMELVEGTSCADLYEVLRRWRGRAGRALRESDLSPAVSTASRFAEKRRKLSSGRRLQEDPGEGLPELERLEPDPPPALGEGRALHHRLAALFADAAGAVAHLHARGILHRDLKPGNLMLTADGRRIVVMDLGLAQVRDRSQSLTRTGTRFVGTLRYTAPEQLQWNLLDVDERADIYGLGASLYEILTLVPIFDGDTEPRLIEQVLREEPRRPRKLDPEVPRDLEAVVVSCLEKDRSHRYANARDLADDLERFCAGAPVRVRPVTAPRRLWRWCRRNPALASASGLALLALVALATVSSLVAVERHRSALDFQRRLAESHLVRGQALCEEGEVERGLHWMARALVEAPREEKALREAILSNLGGWKGLWDPPHAVLDCPGGSVHDVEFSPDGARVATASWWSVILWSVETGEAIGPPFDHARADTVEFSAGGDLLLTVAPGGAARLWSLERGARRDAPLREWTGIHAARFDPAGKRVLTAGERSVRVWPAGTGEPLGKPMEHAGQVRRIAWSPDGTRVLTGAPGGAATLWSTETGEQIFPPLEHGGSLTAVLFSPDGRLLLTAGTDGTARLWSAGSGEPAAPPLAHRDSVLAAAFSPDSRHVLTAGADRTARLWSAETGAAVLPPLEHEGAVIAAAFSPGGRHVLTGSTDDTARLWFLEAGEPVGLPLRHHMELSGVAFSRDGAWLATTSFGHATIWRVADVDSPWRRLTPRGDVWELAFSPDGRMLLTGDDGGHGRLWSVETGEPAGKPLRHEGRVWAAAFSPDGHRIATGGLDRTVRLWSAETGEPLGPALTHPDIVRAVAFERGGKRIATGCIDAAARIWSVETGEIDGQPLLHRGPVGKVAFSPDGELLLTGSEETARLWSVRARDPVGRPLVHQAGVLGVAFSPDGALIATGSHDRTARLWSSRTGEQVGRNLEHPSWVEDVEFSPDGALLLTASGDGAARLWTVEGGHLAGPPLRQRDNMTAATFSPDGRKIATCGWSDPARLWDRPLPIEGNVEKVLLWTEAATGLAMDADGVFRRLDPGAWRERRLRLAP